LVSGQTPSGTVADNPDSPAKEESDADDNLFKASQAAVQQAIAQDAQLQQYADNIAIQQTPEGLRIDITDSDKFAMYERGSAVMTIHAQTILTRMAEFIKKMPNFMSISGHTDASPAETGRADYTNWELSADRAHAARRYLQKSGIEAERTKKVLGLADRELFTPAEPRGPKNRRVTLLMLRGPHILLLEAAVPTGDVSGQENASKPPLEAVPAPAPHAAPAAH
jgi:chemotaxis protein MotB